MCASNRYPCTFSELVCFTRFYKNFHMIIVNVDIRFLQRSDLVETEKTSITQETYCNSPNSSFSLMASSTSLCRISVVIGSYLVTLWARIRLRSTCHYLFHQWLIGWVFNYYNSMYPRESIHCFFHWGTCLGLTNQKT